MYKLDVSQINPIKEGSAKSRLKQSRQLNNGQFRLKQKENQSKHLNSIKPYVIKQRKNSKRDIKLSSGSPYEMTRSKSKKFESNSKKLAIGQSQSIIICASNNSQLMNVSTTNNNYLTQSSLSSLHQQFLALKDQYKTLRTSYTSLLAQKQQIASRQEITCFKYQQELNKAKKGQQFLEQQIERIKKQCFKILESQKFKYKKIQETIQQKQLMIAFLRSENLSLKKKLVPQNISVNSNFNESQAENLQNLFFLQNSAPTFSYESYARLSANTSIMNGSMVQNNVLIQSATRDNENLVSQKQKRSSSFANQFRKKSQFEEDSLSFSRDRSKQFDSVHSLLSNNDQTVMVFTKKDMVILDESLSLPDQQGTHSGVSSSSLKNSFDEVNQCLTFENRGQQAKISKSRPSKTRPDLQITIGQSKSSQIGSKKSKPSRQQTKRQQQKRKQDTETQAKKKLSKNKVKAKKSLNNNSNRKK